MVICTFYRCLERSVHYGLSQSYNSSLPGHSPVNFPRKLTLCHTVSSWKNLRKCGIVLHLVYKWNVFIILNEKCVIVYGFYIITNHKECFKHIFNVPLCILMVKNMDVAYFSHFYSFNSMLLLYDILIILISLFNFDEYFIL